MSDKLRQLSKHATLVSDDFMQTLLASHFTRTDTELSADEVVARMEELIRQVRKGDNAKLILIAGGAASGKSAFAETLSHALTKTGLRADTIGSDDFLRGDRPWRSQFEGKHAKKKYDFDLMNRKISEIRANSSVDYLVSVPTYDQKTGLAIDIGEQHYTHKVGPVDVLLVQTDFDEVKSADLTIFLHMADGSRLSNRIGRDVVHRSESDIQKIIDSFNLRQIHQQAQYTLSVAKTADAVLNINPGREDWQFDVYIRNPS